MAPLPKKSPDLGNSSPVPRALMYVASCQTFGLASSSYGRSERERRDQSWAAAVRIERMERLPDWYEWTLRIQTWFTDFYWALFEWFLCFVSYMPAAPPTPIQLPIPLSWRSCTSTAHPFYPSTLVLKLQLIKKHSTLQQYST
jgi:hypothetical protein